MIQVMLEVLIIGLFTMVAGIIWLVVRDTFGDDHSPDDNRQAGNPSPEPRDGEEPPERSSPQSKAAA